METYEKKIKIKNIFHDNELKRNRKCFWCRAAHNYRLALETKKRYERIKSDRNLEFFNQKAQRSVPSDGSASTSSEFVYEKKIETAKKLRLFLKRKMEKVKKKIEAYLINPIYS